MFDGYTQTERPLFVDYNVILFSPENSSVESTKDFSLLLFIYMPLSPLGTMWQLLFVIMMMMKRFHVRIVMRESLVPRIVNNEACRNKNYVNGNRDSSI